MQQHSFENQVSLQNFNSLGFSATAKQYVAINHADGFVNWWRQLEHTKHLNWLILGGGSNIVFTRDPDALVLHNKCRGIEVLEHNNQSIKVKVAAGEIWHDWVMYSLEQGWLGLENLALIPGSVGACPVQNIGAYGVEVKSLIDSVDVFDFSDQKMKSITASDCKFAYRDSLFKHETFQNSSRYLILSVTFRLTTNPDLWQPNLNYGPVSEAIRSRFDLDCDVNPPSAKQVAQAICDIRNSKLPDPAVLGNVGSFFKNPIVTAQIAAVLNEKYPNMPQYLQPNHQVKLAAGWLIEQAGWKGYTIPTREVGVYPKQALVLVHYGQGSGVLLMELAAAIIKDVSAKFGVAIEPEPIII